MAAGDMAARDRMERSRRLRGWYGGTQQKGCPVSAPSSLVRAPADPKVRLQLAAGNQAIQRLRLNGFPQPQSTRAELGDSYEQEAEQVAAAVDAPAPGPAVRPKCACGGTPGPDGECTACRAKRLALQRRAWDRGGGSETLAAVSEVVRSSGQPLNPSSRTFFESRLGYDFGAVRIHADARAADSARALNAQAYTVGHHIAFAAGLYDPGTDAGQRLLAHELTHVVQQSRATGNRVGQSNDKRGLSPIAIGQTDVSGGGQASVQRKPESKESGPDRARNHEDVRMHFDGRDLIVYADGKEVFRWPAQSGRPVPLDPKDVAACGGDPVTETYMNNPRFVGITDFGPTPEATYQFRAAGIQRFTLEQERTLRWKGHEFILQTPFGPVSGGDWGSGRVELHPITARKEGECGNASKRDGFYLHGGVLAGSSGCIDIGDNHFAELAEWLQGYPQPITLTVKYEHPAPVVGTLAGFSGMLAYGRERISQQTRLAFGEEMTATGETRKVASGNYGIVLQWVGGALAAGLRLDISLSDKDTFVRGGLSGETNFRLLRALYGRLSVGYLQPLSGHGALGGLELGGGFEYDFGRVQLEAIYDVIAPLSNDNRTQQVLLGIGIRR